VYRGALDEVTELLNRLFVVDLCGIPILRHRDKTQIYRDMVSQVLPHSGAHCVTLRYCSGEEIKRTVNFEDSNLSWKGLDPEGQISGIQFSLNTK
jgi:hypothetical protein